MKGLSTRHWTDWVGTLATVALGVSLWRRAPEFGVLVLPILLQDLLVSQLHPARGKTRAVAQKALQRLAPIEVA